MPLQNRYPDANILAQRGHWDNATREVVLDRVHNVPSFRFFDEQERRILTAVCERVMPQGWKDPPRRIPIAPWIDQHCQSHATDGSRLEDMPPSETAWRWGLQGIDESAMARAGRPFVDLTDVQQDEILRSVRDGHPTGATWQKLPAQHFWKHVLLRQITAVYYAHPFAWDEIGFGGPAYPRGYFALNFGAPEPWEPREVPTERAR